MKLPVSVLILIMVAGIMFFLFVSFDSVFHGDGGIQDKLWSNANETMTGDSWKDFNQAMPRLRDGFGVAFVLCFFMAIVVFLAEVFRSPGGEV